MLAEECFSDGSDDAGVCEPWCVTSVHDLEMAVGEDLGGSVSNRGEPIGSFLPQTNQPFATARLRRPTLTAGLRT